MKKSNNKKNNKSKYDFDNNSSKKQVKVRKVLNIPRTIVFILFIYILITSIIYVYKEPVHHYEITGNNYYSDIYIIRLLGLENYPSFVSINTFNLENELKSNSLIKDAKVSYGLNFTLKINITENEPMFLYKTTNEIELSDGSLISNDGTITNIPVLLNQTPSEQLTDLAINLQKVDKGVYYLISEIIYSPSYNSSGELIDDKRFLLSMSDQNQVYISTNTVDNLNLYLSIIANDKITSSGTLFLDGDSDNHTFKVRST